MACRGITKKPFCKVCCDAGKSEAVYTSHWVKNKPGHDGLVVCPTLLSQRCGYCDGVGHTPTYCKVLANDKKSREKEQHHRERELRRRAHEDALPSKKAQSSSTKNFGAFSAFIQPPAFSKKIKVEEFPSLTKSTAASKPNAADRQPKTGYANACIKAEIAKETEKLNAQLSDAKKITILKPVEARPFVSPKVCNWADYDSDEE
jgi:hypothetical protein